MGFNTGDNEPKGRHLLEEALGKLFKAMPGQVMVLGNRSDARGLYSKLVRMWSGQAFVVARGDLPFKEGCVSTQRILVKEAADRRIPILMYYKPGDCFYLFDAVKCLEEERSLPGENDRFLSNYVNYPIKLGRRFNLT